MAQLRFRHLPTVNRATVLAFVVCGIGAFEPSVGAAEPVAPERRASLRSEAEIERMLQRADACMAADRHAEAEEILRVILDESPDNARAYEAIVKATAARDLAAVSGASRAAQQRLSEKFAIHQTDRFVFFSDVSADLTVQNARWVERAHEEFVRFANDCELRPLPLQHKLVCVLFDRREEYLAFAQSHDGLKNVAFTGYYSPRWDRVVFSVDQPATPGPATGERATAKANSASNEKPVLGFEDSKPVKHDGSCSDSHQNHATLGGNAAAKCIHETIHQLMFHTQLMRSDVQYPLWICEGLSTAFETDTPGDPFGPDRDYQPRLEAFEALMDQHELLPLRDLVTVTQITSSKSPMLRTVYQQSYSLVTWMCRERKAQLRKFLTMMREQPAGKLHAARHLEIFEQAFGEVDRVEADWLAYERIR